MKTKVNDLIVEGYKKEIEKNAEKIIEVINNLDMNDEITLMTLGAIMHNAVAQTIRNKEVIDDYYKYLAEETHRAFNFFKGE